MKKTLLISLLLIRLFTNQGWFNENRNIKPRHLQSPEIFRFIRRPSKRGKKKNQIISQALL